MVECLSYFCIHVFYTRLGLWFIVESISASSTRSFYVGSEGGSGCYTIMFMTHLLLPVSGEQLFKIFNKKPDTGDEQW